jgi:hypothetical protein
MLRYCALRTADPEASLGVTSAGDVLLRGDGIMLRSEAHVGGVGCFLIPPQKRQPN